MALEAVGGGKVLGRTQEEIDAMSVSDLAELVGSKFQQIFMGDTATPAGQSAGQLPAPVEMETNPEAFAAEESPVPGMDAGVADVQDEDVALAGKSRVRNRIDAARAAIQRQRAARERFQEGET